ncbi:hypothetical protein GWP40_03275 [Treponema vincentii]|uniref:hypothetical protein n=1 Tax=Treponema vincentii TaxID=69710 RepID=UPI001BAF8F62|nr:hypothetical protein [Treponema vincentii]QUY16978.1 hypothetical protein GWP40_03275 [Treponema vincentii]
MTKRILGIYLRTKILKAQRRVRAANAQFTAAYNEDIQGAKTTKTLLQKKGTTINSIRCSSCKKKKAYCRTKERNCSV